MSCCESQCQKIVLFPPKQSRDHSRVWHYFEENMVFILTAFFCDSDIQCSSSGARQKKKNTRDPSNIIPSKTTINSIKDNNQTKLMVIDTIAGFHLTSWRPCWCTLKRILIICFVCDTNMAAISIVFCVSWDCVKTKSIWKNYPSIKFQHKYCYRQCWKPCCH